jgi:hypothetical protein
MHRTIRLFVFLLAGECICAAQLPSIVTSTLPVATTGGVYSATLFAGGGTPPYSNWMVGAGAFPPGLSLNASTGAISGKSTASGTFNFFVTVQDSAGGISPAQALTIVSSAPAISTTSAGLPSATVGVAYSVGLVATGGTPPYSNWTVASGALPQGLVLNSATGAISGAPISNGASSFTVTLQDSTGVTSAPQSLTIVTGVAIITGSAPKGTLTGPYSLQLLAGGGSLVYSNWVVSSGVLPPGLTLTASSGLLSGIPVAVGSYSFSITVTDSAGANSMPQPYTIVIAPVPQVVTGALWPGLPGVVYSSTLQATGGTAPLLWMMTDGTLPAGLSLNPGTGVISGTPQSAAGSAFNFSVKVTDSLGVASTPQPLSIAITQAQLTLSPTSLTFNTMAGDVTPPAVQSISVFSLSSPVTFSATTATASGGNWLNVTGGGKTPGNLLVSVNTGGLSPNTSYHGTITIAGQNISPSTVPVTLVVGVGGAPQMTVTPSALSLSYVQGVSSDQRYLLISNMAGGTVHFNAKATTDSCGSWLSLLNTTGSATSALPGVVPIYISPAGLAEKSCTGAITITDSGTGQTQQVAVAMTVSSQTQALYLTRTGLNFEAGIGTNPPVRSFSVLNPGQGTVGWTASSQTADTGKWLNVTPATGSSTAGVMSTPVMVSLNSQGLAPGLYNGSVQISSSDVGDSAQTVSVMLNVMDSPASPPPMTPSGVILVGQSGGMSDAQTVTLFNPWPATLTYTSTVVTDNRVNWLTQTPTTGTLAPNGGATTSMTLQANLKGLTAGLQHGVVRAAFNDGTVHTLDVYLIVPASAVVASVRSSEVEFLTLKPDAVAQSCPGGAGIATVFRSPEQNFEVTAQVPVALEVISRDCATGKAIRHAAGAAVQVLIGGPNNPPVALIDDGSGVWTGTWTPAAAASQVNLTARTDLYSGNLASVISAQTTLSGVVDAPPSTQPDGN